MAFFTRNPTANTTPDPAQGGGAVAGNSNTGHSSSTCTGADFSSETKSCLWTGFAGVSGVLISAVLKFDWVESGSFPGGTDAVTNFRVQYSVNGGGGWNTIFQHDDLNGGPTSSSSEVALPAGQNITQVQVRDRLFADGNELGAFVEITGSISNIRVEVTTQDGNVIVIM